MKQQRLSVDGLENQSTRNNLQVDLLEEMRKTRKEIADTSLNKCL